MRIFRTIGLRGKRGYRRHQSHPDGEADEIYRARKGCCCDGVLAEASDEGVAIIAICPSWVSAIGAANLSVSPSSAARWAADVVPRDPTGARSILSREVLSTEVIGRSWMHGRKSGQVENLIGA